MSYDVPIIEGEAEVEFAGSSGAYPLWEVFVRAARGLNHVHAGSVHAADAEAAVQSARDVYTRRAEGVSLWVVRSTEIHASDPHDGDAWFDTDHPYRHPTFYDIPDEVGHM
ncbi:MAG: 1,2-phenylacetyl-CoA epoxidase subunit PaaB [Acidimicrobiia bacterium]|nr:1,2-phenylacetyl-CoA epoxidase subunit PaaB [Acidimicrobiia bacterium]